MALLLWASVNIKYQTLEYIKFLFFLFLAWAPHSTHFNSDPVFDVSAQCHYHVGCQMILWLWGKKYRQFHFRTFSPVLQQIIAHLLTPVIISNHQSIFKKNKYRIQNTLVTCACCLQSRNISSIVFLKSDIVPGNAAALLNYNTAVKVKKLL